MCENICQDYISCFPEVHLLWAQHQVHHSSEEYNLAVGLRQSALQGWCGFVCFCNFTTITNDGKLSQTLCALPHSFQQHIVHILQHVFTVYTNHIARKSYTSFSYHWKHIPKLKKCTGQMSQIGWAPILFTYIAFVTSYHQLYHVKFKSAVTTLYHTDANNQRVSL
jgi:hypothetical protein